MIALRRLADFKVASSPARRFRSRRFELFRALASRLPRPVSILDVGGTPVFWEAMGWERDPEVSIVILNLDGGVKPSGALRAIVGDARDLSRFGDRSFDVVFSNSVIEHVGDLDDQRRAAREIRRVGKAYFVQTPNRGFPIEPHFLFPFFQHLSVPARVFLLTHFSIGWWDQIANRDEARKVAEAIRLLDRRTLLELFPGAQLWEERVLGLVKSFVVHGGFAAA